ncbi:MAG: flagellar biosynthetic protein FliO [Acidimicrobiales bacterium]|jgi:flagellar protein FliO/FliZ|nr:flagellar biosynthetic protein FliO [Acidimicrobiales bacterium]
MGDPSLFSALVRVAIVMALLFGTLRVIGRITGRRAPGGGRGVVRRNLGGGAGARRLVEVLDRQNLGKTTSIALVRIGDRRIALGVTEQRIDVLLQLDPELEAPDDDHDEVIDVIDLTTSSLGELSSLGDLSTPAAARMRAVTPARPWKDLIEDLRERTIR